jgi:hypothetical protein
MRQVVLHPALKEDRHHEPVLSQYFGQNKYSLVNVDVNILRGYIRKLLIQKVLSRTWKHAGFGF